MFRKSAGSPNHIEILPTLLLLATASTAQPIATAPLIKIKVDVDAPADQIRAVRNAAPEVAPIVDPNESWDRAVLESL